MNKNLNFNTMYLTSDELKDKRDYLKEKILNDFNNCFPQYETDVFENIRFQEEEIQSWVNDWSDALKEIKEIDNIEQSFKVVNFNSIRLIHEDFFVKYIKDLELLNEGMNLLSSYILNNINWEGVANELRLDYTEFIYQDETYLY